MNFTGFAIAARNRFSACFLSVYLRARGASGYRCRACALPLEVSEIARIVTEGCPGCGQISLEVVKCHQFSPQSQAQP